MLKLASKNQFVIEIYLLEIDLIHIIKSCDKEALGLVSSASLSRLKHEFSCQNLYFNVERDQLNFVDIGH